jgi:hypothetical protein
MFNMNENLKDLLLDIARHLVSHGEICDLYIRHDIHHLGIVIGCDCGQKEWVISSIDFREYGVEYDHFFKVIKSLSNMRDQLKDCKDFKKIEKEELMSRINSPTIAGIDL